MPEDANAKPVTVEPIEAFLRKEEPAIEAQLVAQEDWARANLSNYPVWSKNWNGGRTCRS